MLESARWRGSKSPGRDLRVSRGARVFNQEDTSGSLNVGAAAVPEPPDGVLLDPSSRCCPASPEDIRDWLCDAPLAERFDQVSVWVSPLPNSPAEGWRQNPGVRQVLKLAVNPERSACPGAKQIVAFAALIGADREERLLLLFGACSISAISCPSLRSKACVSSCCALRSWAKRSHRLMRRWRRSWPKVGLG
jgi:hypothetical protein